MKKKWLRWLLYVPPLLCFLRSFTLFLYARRPDESFLFLFAYGWGILGLLVLSIAFLVDMLSRPDVQLKPGVLTPICYIVPKKYSSFFALVGGHLTSRGYRPTGTIKNRLGCEMTLFANTVSFAKLDFFLFLRMEEYTKEIRDAYLPLFLNHIQNTLKPANGEEIMLIACVCADRITPAFEAHLKTPVQPEGDMTLLTAGVSFAERAAYVAKWEDSGLTRRTYKTMRNTFLRCTHCPPDPEEKAVYQSILYGGTPEEYGAEEWVIGAQEEREEDTPDDTEEDNS